MINAIKRFFLACFGPELLAELAQLRGELAVSKKQLTDVKAELALVEEDRHKLLDWVLIAAGQHPLYSNEPVAKPQTKGNPLGGITQGRDFARIATMVENEAFRDVEFHK